MSRTYELSVSRTAIPGLLVLRLPVHGDARGWFKENWQRAKMTDLGLPDFAPVQHSVAHNGSVGTTRGIHAEPWDKLVSIASGRAFGAWVDLREGPTYGTLHTETLDESTAVFVPRGVGNSYQTLVPDTVYSYLVNAHWSADAAYTHLNLADPTAAVPWPIPLTEATISDKDRAHSELTALSPVTPTKTLILGPERSGREGTSTSAPGSPAGELGGTRPGRSRVGRFLRLRQRRTRCSTQRVTPPSTRPRQTSQPLGRPTPPESQHWPGPRCGIDSRWCTTPPTTSSTAPGAPGPRAPTARATRSRHSVSTASRRLPANWPSPVSRGTT